MTARGLIVGILICLLVECVAFVGWRLSGRSLNFIPDYGSFYDTSTYSPDTTTYYSTDSAYPSYTKSIDYTSGIKKSVAQLKSEVDRIAIPQIMEDLSTKDTLEILRVKFASDICQEVSCRGAAPETVKKFVEEYSSARAVEDSHNVALRNAAATERNGLFTLGAGVVALFSLFLGVLNFRQNLRGNKRAST